jgi:hypothetical protein
MTASLPQDVQAVFDRFITTEYTTVDGSGQPITWPVTPYYEPGGRCIDVTTGIGYPKKANDARANPKVALLFSDPTGSGLADPPMVLVQGTADVDDRDFRANRERYRRESLAKLPGAKKMQGPQLFQGLMGWYFNRIYVHVRPERVYVWPGCDVTREPELYDSHIEEVRSGHDEEPEQPPAQPRGGDAVWDQRMDELGRRYTSAVLSLVSPDGFPFAVRIPLRVDRDERQVWLGAAPVGVPLAPGLACLTAHDHDDTFSYQRNFHVRGDLVEHDGGWVVRPRKLVGGFEMPPGSFLARVRLNLRKLERFRRQGREEMKRRERRAA